VIAAYVSGHGFGHATRTTEVLRALRELEPGLPLAVVSSAPEWLFRRALGEPLVFRSRACDVGLAQRGALEIDEPGTARAWQAFASGWERLVSEEAEWLRASGARVVLADIPPAACVAAARAGLPAVALANFSWDWIYRHYAGREPVLGQAAEACRAAYAGTDLLLRLPFAGDLSAFPRVLDVGLVARRPRLTRREARARLGWDDRPSVLLSFGGLGLPGFDAACLAPLGAYRFVLPERLAGAPGNVEAAEEARLTSAGLGFADLVAAVDVVVSKPGYGIVTDCIGAGTRLVYTPRGDFPEYEVLTAGMPRYLPCVAVGNAALRRGELQAALADCLAQPFPPQPDLGGAARAAERLLQQGA
jgi:L-arabinokinase